MQTARKSFDAVQMKRDVQEKMRLETLGMSSQDRIAYYRRGAEALRRQLQEESGDDPGRFQAVLDALAGRKGRAG